MKLAITGHRPNKLGNDYDLKSPLTKAIENRLQQIVNELNPTLMISGMALGIDTLWAQLALKNGIDLLAAIPFKGQEITWPEKSQRLYHYILDQAKYIVYVSEGSYSAYKMQVRNIWMVEECDKLVAVWDGTSGGTKNCVEYADGKKEIIIVNPKDYKP